MAGQWAIWVARNDIAVRPVLDLPCTLEGTSKYTAAADDEVGELVSILPTDSTAGSDALGYIGAYSCRPALVPIHSRALVKRGGCNRCFGLLRSGAWYC